MTIIIDWCDKCGKYGKSYESICRDCGKELVVRPKVVVTSTTLGPYGPQQLGSDRQARALRTANDELASLLANIREQVNSLRSDVNSFTEEWRLVSSNTEGSEGQQQSVVATPQAILDSLPRFKIQVKSSILSKVSLRIGKTSYRAILGEFGPSRRFRFTGNLVAAHPSTGKDLRLSDETIYRLGHKAIAYMERGDGITFVQKALLAQAAGAVAVIIGNNTSSSWPYIMKDPRGESKDLKIPVVMLKQSDGNDLKKLCEERCEIPCVLSIYSSDKECMICCDHMMKGQTVLRIPSCAHTFHEDCAIQWLAQNNSCPCCRTELPLTPSKGDSVGSERTALTQASSNGEDVETIIYR